MNKIDSREITRDGITYRVDVYPDTDATPNDADCYSPADIAAWRRDDWHFVGVVVTPIVNGVEIGGADASLWGLQYGWAPSWRRYIDTDELVGEYPVPDMIADIAGRLADGITAKRAELLATADKLAA
ncbi:hypothetical protein [Microbispora sp. NPDC049633]|uniref:hypothetical protein n=1 Tax=Microbispora sp. NPDC049633 TaxID=3154355 RepID=UPI00342783C6